MLYLEKKSNKEKIFRKVREKNIFTLTFWRTFKTINLCSYLRIYCA